MTEAALIDQIQTLTALVQQSLREQTTVTAAILLSLQMQGQRLSRADMCKRLGVTPKTLSKRIITGHVPQPGSDGKWLLSEVVEMECQR